MVLKQSYRTDALFERKNAFHLLAKNFGVFTVPLEKSSSTCWNLCWQQLLKLSVMLEEVLGKCYSLQYISSNCML